MCQHSEQRVAKLQRKPVDIFYCNELCDSPRTGGEIENNNRIQYLQKQKDVNVKYLNDEDVYYLNESGSLISINYWFFKRFTMLNPGTVVIENSMFPFAFFICNWLSKLCNKQLRFVVIVLELPFPIPTGLRALKQRFVFSALLNSASVIVTNSKFIREQMVTFGVPSNKVSVIYPPGQKLSRKSIVGEQEKSPLQIICVSNIRCKKGQEYLVHALHLLRDLDFNAILVGMTKEEEYTDRVRRLIKEYGLCDRVKLTGWVSIDELARAYETSTVFVLPSLYEPLGIVIQEAMSFRLPILATNVGGIPEQVRDGKEALLVPPADPEAMSNELRRLLTEPALRQMLGHNAGQRLQTMPTWDQACEQFYRTLVGIL